MSDQPLASRHRDSREPLFTFAVIADSHMNPEDDASSSPWEVNRLSNGRTRGVVAELNELSPDFVVHLGDMIHPVPSQDAYPIAAQRFHDLVDDLQMPLHVVPGNHDVGDKPLDWTPAAVVTEQFVELYEQHFGPSYYSFTHDGCTFVVLNAQLLNSGFPAEAAQRDWFEETVRGAGRCFLFLHYPPYVLDADEAGHYDNIDEPARSWLLDRIRASSVEAVFAGHVHNFFYDRACGADFYVLPSVSFVRSDYSELARIVPQDRDHGRNDVDKLGYFLVQVLADGHRPVIRRTYGREESNGSRGMPVLPTPVRGEAATSVGVDLRYPWAEIIEIPQTGGVDEFARKRARNDYPLMALWELGIKHLRVPIADLTDPTRIQRARSLADNGQRFTPFAFGIPDLATTQALLAERSLLDGVELILADNHEGQLDAIADLRERLQVPIAISKLRGHDDVAAGAGTFNHVINHGFIPAEIDELEQLLNRGARRFADAMVFRIGHEVDPVQALSDIDAATRELGVWGVAYVRLAGENPAEAIDDERQSVHRVATTLAASTAHPRVGVFLDSFVDQDRGYFPRPGLIDRRFNPRTAGKIFRTLNAVLADDAKILTAPESFEIPSLWLRSREVVQVLLMPRTEQKLRNLPLPQLEGVRSHSEIVIIDLVDGRRINATYTTVEDRLELDEPWTISTPTLVEITTGACA